MAVGDDDQAIYAFQGAEVSNMVAFAEIYRQPEIITLKENYRSTQEILEASYSIADQITDRLDSALPGTTKELTAQASHKKSTIQHPVFSSELAQYDWIAEQIDNYLKQGIDPQSIAVIAPRHRYLERLMPYLGNRRLPVAYERRENILDAPIVMQLLTMAELVNAIAENRHRDVDTLFSQVLAYDFWEVPADVLLEISLQAYKQNLHWLELLNQHKDSKIKSITGWFLELAQRALWSHWNTCSIS
jgi:DNA helicase II / ATP-dependent DNA helicase PcrA